MKIKKSLVALTLAFVTLGTNVMAQEMSLGGTKVDLDVKNVNGSNYIPLRDASKYLRLDVSYDNKTGNITVKDPRNTMVMKAGSTKAKFNGSDLTLITPPKDFNGKTYLPLRAIAQEFGFKVAVEDGIVTARNFRKGTEYMDNHDTFVYTDYWYDVKSELEGDIGGCESIINVIDSYESAMRGDGELYSPHIRKFGYSDMAKDCDLPSNIGKAILDYKEVHDTYSEILDDMKNLKEVDTSELRKQAEKVKVDLEIALKDAEPYYTWDGPARWDTNSPKWGMINWYWGKTPKK